MATTQPYSFTLDHKLTRNFFSIDSIILMTSIIFLTYSYIYSAFINSKIMRVTPTETEEINKLTEIRNRSSKIANLGIAGMVVGLILFIRVR